MNANVPEKIYLHIRPNKEIGSTWHGNKISDTDIEYTRTDAFIEKAEEFIYSALNDGIMGTANIEDFMRLFKKIYERRVRYGNNRKNQRNNL